jgi:CBS-domain-containing membrane protein
MPNCSQVMTHDPVFCLASDTVDRAAQLMRQEDVGSLPVIESYQNKRLIGIITDRDIALKVVAEKRDANMRAQEVMTHNPVTCHADNDIQVALNAMASHQLRRIPVVDDKNQVVGIISQSDVATRVSEPARPNLSKRFQSLQPSKEALTWEAAMAKHVVDIHECHEPALSGSEAHSRSSGGALRS